MNGSLTYEGSTLLSGSISVNAGGRLQEKKITENGIYTPDQGYDGFSKVEVDVDVPLIDDLSTEIFTNGTHSYTPQSGSAFGRVDITVDVPTPEPVITSLNLEINDNGITRVSEKPSDTDGFFPIEITTNVPTYENVISSPKYIIYKEVGMSITYNWDNVVLNYVSGNNMGCSLNGIVNLSGKGFNKLKYDITTGISYDSINSQNVRPIVIGVTNQVRTSYVYCSQATASQYFSAYNVHDVNDINKHITGEVDISNVTGDMYLLFVATGWNCTINKLELE